MSQEQPVIFISYATPDRDRVQPFHDHLKAAGFAVWMDHEQLKPGQQWDFEIRRALGHADFVLIFISSNSVNRRGYVQRELKAALDRLSERLTDDIFIIPVILDDDINVPSQLESLHHISASRPDCLDKIIEAINAQRERQGVARSAIEQRSGLSWNFSTLKESWDGLPGYETTVQFIELNSKKYDGLADIGRVIRGYFLEIVLNHRAIKLEQTPSNFNHAEDRFLRTNTYDATCGPPSLIGDVLSIPYDFTWYGAGAAHPNHGHKVFNFYLRPVAIMPSLGALFVDSQKAFSAMQTECRNLLKKIEDDDGTPLLSEEWINRGTSEWESFRIHGYVPDGIRLFFPPYYVGPYAYGSHVITISFRTILAFMRPEFVSALNLRALQYQMERENQ